MPADPNPPLAFFELMHGIGAGSPAPAAWQPLAARPLLILVGVTGVGKSTTLSALSAQGVACTLLPDRRVLTDALIIAAMQAADGQPATPVHDRALRFDYTRRFRERHPGGMAHALTLLAVDPAQRPGLLLFDGLRGDNEIEYACAALPRACFAMLDAPDAVRVARLLERGDAFDRIGAGSASHPDLGNGLGEGEELFTPEERAALLRLVSGGAVSGHDLRAKVKIVVEERRNYDPAATRRALERCAAGRSLVIDTTRHSPPAAARLLAAQTRRWFGS